MLIKKMHVEGCDMRRTALLRQQHPRCISSIACRISAVRVPAAGQPCGACACRGRHHHPRRASPLAAHTADTVAPHGARARSPVGGGCIGTRHSPGPSRRGGLPRTRRRRGCGWAVGSTALAVLRMQLQPPPQPSLLLHRGHGVRKHQAQRTVLPDGRAYLSCDHARPTPRPDLPDADACGGEGSYSAGEPA